MHISVFEHGMTCSGHQRTVSVVSSVLHADPESRTHVLMLGGKDPDSLSHLTSPQNYCFFFLNLESYLVVEQMIKLITKCNKGTFYTSTSWKMHEINLLERISQEMKFNFIGSLNKTQSSLEWREL